MIDWHVLPDGIQGCIMRRMFDATLSSFMSTCKSGHTNVDYRAELNKRRARRCIVRKLSAMRKEVISLSWPRVDLIDIGYPTPGCYPCVVGEAMFPLFDILCKDSESDPPIWYTVDDDLYSLLVLCTDEF